MAPLSETYTKSATVISLEEKKHNIKFRQIVHTTSQYEQSFPPKTISAWNGLTFAEAPSLVVLRSNLFKINVHPFRIIP